MNICILSQFFPPEMEPSGLMFSSLAENLSKYGHKVSVVSGFANFPKGKFFNKKVFEIFRSVKINGINMKYIIVYPSNNKNNLSRVLNYLSYMLTSIISVIFSFKRYDVIIATSPPLTTAMSGLLIAKILRTKYILDIRDIWPESAIQLGHLKNKYLINLAKRIEDCCYKYSDGIVVATPGMKRIIDKKVSVKEKVYVIQCGVSGLVKYDIECKKYSNPYKEDEGKFIILYSGLHGYAQGLLTIVDSMNIVNQQENEIVLYLIGDGPDKEKIVNYVKEKSIKNVKFLDSVSKSEIRKYITYASCGLVPLRNQRVFDTVYPSKTFEYMALGLPIIVGVKGDIADLVINAKCGFAVEPENENEYAKAIIDMKKNDQARIKFSENGKKYGRKYFDSDNLDFMYMNIIEKFVNKKD